MFVNFAVRLRPLAILAVLAALVLAANASAARVPPGNAGAVQYSETLPGAGGEETSPKATDPQRQPAAGKEAGGGSVAVSGQTASELEELGRDGKAALDLANANAPAAPATDPDRGGGKSGGGAWSDTEGSSGFGTVLGGAIVGSSGGGLVQPLILALLVLAGGAYLWRRRHSDPSGRNEN